MKSTFALTATKLVLQAVIFLKVVFLARLLSPFDFGLMGIAVTAVATLESITVTGVDLNLIRKSGDIDQYLDTAWTISILRGAALGILLFLLSGSIADFFNSPASEGMLKVIGLVFLLRGMINSSVVYFVKTLEIRKQIVLNSVEVFADVVVSVLVTLAYRSAWGLVVGFVTGAAARCVASFLVHKNVPSLRFDLGKIRELSRFGKYVWGTNLAVFMGNKLDSIAIGKVLGPVTLGIYQMALKFTDPIAKEFGGVMAQILFPAYSSIHTDKEKIRRAYLYTVKIVFSVFFVVALMVGIYSQHIIPLVLGEQWLAVIPIVQLLTVAALFKSVFSIDGWLYYAIGMPKYNFVATLIRFCVLILIVVPLVITLGGVGAAWAVLISNFLLFIPVIFFAKKTINLTLFQYLANIWVPFLVASLTIVPVFIVVSFSPWPEWWLAAGLGITTCLAAFYVYEKDVCMAIISKLS